MRMHPVKNQPEEERRIEAYEPQSQSEEEKQIEVNEPQLQNAEDSVPLYEDSGGMIITGSIDDADPYLAAYDDEHAFEENDSDDDF